MTVQGSNALALSFFYARVCKMIRYLTRRLALLLPTLLGISLITFILLRLIPGDPAQIMLGEHATAEQITRFRADRGLDQPILIQYLHYMGSLARGDWGRSIQTNLPVINELAQRLPATVELSLGAMLIACAVGIPLGILAACHRNSFVDLLVSGGTLIGVSVPLFFLGLFLSYFFGYVLNWLPPSWPADNRGRMAVLDSKEYSHFQFLHSEQPPDCQLYCPR